MMNREYALITGATSGLGNDFSRLLAFMGYNLILFGRNTDKLNEIKKEYEQECGINVLTFAFDLSNINELRNVLECVKKYNTSVVINCAGFGKVGDFRDSCIDCDINMINTNITAVHVITKFFSKYMKKGHIMNVASIAGFVPGPLMSQYGATKAYVVKYSLGASYELKKKKSDVKLSVLCPGPLRTNFDHNAGAKGNINQMDSMKCARYALKQMKKGKKLIIPGGSVKIGYFMTKIMPIKILLPVEYWIQGKKI